MGDNKAVATVDDRTEYRVLVLNDENYITWKWQMTLVLKTKGLYGCVSSPDITNEVKERQAVTLLASALSTDNMQRVINCTTAHSI